MGASVSSSSHGCLIRSLFLLSILPRRLRDSQPQDEVWQRLEPNFKNAKLIVNLGAGLFEAFPFSCSAFADIATEDHGALVSRGERIMRCVWWSPLDFLMKECSTA